MNNKLFKTLILLSIIPLVISNTSIYAFVGEGAGIDFFKTIDKGTTSTQTKMIENELVGSAKKINDYVTSRMFVPSDNVYPVLLDSSKDFTKTELDRIRDDEVISMLYSHLSSEYQTGDKTITAHQLTEIRRLVVEWYSSKEGEIIQKMSSMNTIGVSGLYNDGNKENSGYDIIDDLTKIHNVIFSQETTYEGVENGTSLEFGDISNGSRNNVSSVFTPTSALTSGNTGVGGTNPQTTGGSQNTGNNNTSGNTGGTTGDSSDTITPEQKLEDMKSESNNCSSGSDLGGLNDNSLLTDLQNQLLYGESSSSTTGGAGNSNGENTNNNGGNGYGTGSTGAGNGAGGTVGSTGGDTDGGGSSGLFDSFPCSSFFCIEISMTMYNQKILGGAQTSIEGVVDKHLKIIDEYAGKSMIQSDMTKNFFGLSILRNLNLSSMVYLGMVVTHLPPPILNLPKKSGTESNELIDETILERTFKQNGLDYKRQNFFSPDKEYEKLSQCVGLEISECLLKTVDNQTLYTPYISNSNILISKIGESYKGSVNDDIAELIGFSNTFKTNVDQITQTIAAMKKDKQ